MAHFHLARNTWAAWAYTELGDGDQAGKLFSFLSAITHSDTRQKAAHYRVEPYVTAADVYGVAPFTGRGGWSWYTGSGGWLYRLGLEAILGLKRRGRTLSISPCVPSEWAGHQITYRYGKAVYKIVVVNPDQVCSGVASVTLDGEPVPEKQVVLEDDGAEHRIDVRMGMDSPTH